MSTGSIQKNEAKALSPKAKTDAFMHEVVTRATTFQRLLPKGMDPEWFIAEVRVAVARAPKLIDCDKVSTIDALTTCAQLGLSPSGRLGSAYLIPYGTKCTLVIGYKGYVELAYRSGDVMGFGAQVVHENEPFEVSEGFDLTIHKHDRDVDNPGSLRAVYAWATLRGGYTVKVLMWAREVLAIKARSKAASSGPWVTDEAEMWKKTAVRRLIKMLPLSPQKAQAFHKAQEAEDAEWEEAIDVTADVEAPSSATAGLKNRLKASNGGQRAEATLDAREVERLPLSHPDAEPPEPGSEG